MDDPRNSLLEELADAEELGDILLVEQKFAVLDQHPQ